MNRVLSILFVGLVAVNFTGCATYSAHEYSISADNMATLKEIGDYKVNLGEFTSTKKGLHSIMCRGAGVISPPNKITYANYVKNALSQEFKFAERFSATAPITLTGNLDKVIFSSNRGIWDFEITLNSTNGKSVAVVDRYDFRTSFFAGRACHQVSLNLSNAVKAVIKKLVNHAEFAALVK